MAFTFKKLFSTVSSLTAEDATTVVGVDIGAASVKVVEIEQGPSTSTLVTYGELQLAPYANAPLGSAVELTLEQKIEATVDVLREAGSAASRAVIVVPLSQSFVTSIQLSDVTEETIAPRINVEARKYIPVPLNEVVLEWAELSPLSATPENVREILLAAIKVESMQATEKILSALHKPTAVPEIEVFSTQRALVDDTEGAVAVLDMGAATNKLMICEGGYVRQIHRTKNAGVSATEQLAAHLALDFVTAENLKRNFTPDAPQAQEIKKIVLGNYERTLQEFKRVLQQYEARHGATISKVIVSGGASAFPDFVSFVQYSIERPVERAMPFKKVKHPAFLEDTLTEIGGTFAGALGAALRPLDV